MSGNLVSVCRGTSMKTPCAHDGSLPDIAPPARRHPCASDRPAPRSIVLSHNPLGSCLAHNPRAIGEKRRL